MSEIYDRKYFSCFTYFISSHVKSKTLPRNSFVSLRDMIKIYKILIKRDRVNELTIGLRNKKLVYQGRLFNPYSVCAERKDKAKDQVLDATKNATEANNSRVEALLWWKQYGLLQATTRRTLRPTRRYSIPIQDRFRIYFTLQIKLDYIPAFLSPSVIWI